MVRERDVSYRHVAQLVLSLTLVACGGRAMHPLPRTGGGGAPGSGGSGGSNDLGGASGSPDQAGTTGSSDGGTLSAPPACPATTPGRVTSSRTFVVDQFGPSPIVSPLSAEPAGLVRCGDGWCLAGELDSRVAFDRDLVAEGHDDAYLVKLAEDGTPVWSRRLGGTTTTDRLIASSIGADREGKLAVGVVCQGELVLADADDRDVLLHCPSDERALLLLRFDENGAFLWSAELGTSWVIPAQFRVAVDADGRTVVAAHVGGPIGKADAPRERALVVAFDPQGNELFRRSFEGGVTYPTGLALDGAGNSVLTGFFASGVKTFEGDTAGDAVTELDTAGSAICALKLDSAGELVWSRCFGGKSQQALGPHLALGPDASVVLAGEFVDELDFGAIGQDAAPSPSRLASNGSTDMYLAKLDASGRFLWQEGFGNEDDQDFPLGMAVSEEGVIVALGTTRGPLVLAGTTLEAGTSPSPFIATFGPDGEPMLAASLGQHAYIEGSSGIALGDCRSFYFAADYRGDLLSPNVPSMTAADGIVFATGRY